jgi:hypothetical protein
VWTAEGAVNINTAGFDVLTALTNDVSLAELFMIHRPGMDGQFGTDDDCKATADTTQEADTLAMCLGRADSNEVRNLLAHPKVNVGVSSSVFRLRAEAATTQPVTRYRIEAIMTRQAEQEPAVLAWRELR